VFEPIETILGLRQRLNSDEGAGSRGLVPTMGALHEGHAALIRLARRECDTVVVSIFVNPLQFDRAEDLSRYPRTLEQDLALCRDLGVDVVFAPQPEVIYPHPPECTVDVGRLADHLCGKFRPGHFRGVATIVLKLFQLVQPHRAYFGEKDAQQLAVVRRMVADFSVPVTIIEVPTVRESDGLAMSSRNRHLTASQRASAAALYQALLEARRLISAGERDAAAITKAAAAKIAATDVLKLEYLDVADPHTMQPVTAITGQVRVAGAVWAGATRLIDNLLVDVPGAPSTIRSSPLFRH
jgi:pantoate--beta-alanine ligase